MQPTISVRISFRLYQQSFSILKVRWV